MRLQTDSFSVQVVLAMPLTAGSRLGPYEVESAIGAGGMGEVYKARDTRLDRSVAIKVLPATTLTDETARARLLREARTACSRAAAARVMWRERWPGRFSSS